jgi:hypothetical protein
MHFKAVRIGIVGIVTSLAWVALGTAQELMSPVRIEAPSEVIVGAKIEVRWHGEVGKKDFISLDPAGAPENKYGSYFYSSRAMPGTLRAPDTPGSYEVRYHSAGKGYPVRGVSPIEVVDTTATLEGPLVADSGAKIELHWSGPANQQDFISIDAVGSAENKYGRYIYAKKSPATIRAPEEPGQYIIRYHLAQSYRVIGQTELTVGSVTATLEAPTQIQAGGMITVSWQGPNGRGDYVSIGSPDSPDREYIQYSYTRQGNPAVIRVPEQSGSYEIRYHQGQKLTVLARIPLEILANKATVAGPPSVSGGSEFEVTWTGPDNSGDYITIVPTGARPQDYLSYHYTKLGSPGTVEAPLEPGIYDLRYVTGQSRSILAQVTIEVTPGAVPGELRVIAAGQPTTAESTGAVEVILDASGSMLKRLKGERRIEIAKAALENLTSKVLPRGTQFALRVFGHREADSCRTDLEIPVASLDASAVSAKIQTIQAMNLAKTPIAASLSKVRQDLAGISGPITVVLLTDGEETCGGDPRAAIEELRRAGLDVRVNIVGFAINELQLKEQFEAWARIGNGRYIEAHDKEDLWEAMSRSLDVPFEVLSGANVVATGVVNGEALLLLPGKYQVRLLGSNPRDLAEVEIEARSKIDLSADPARNEIGTATPQQDDHIL